MTRLPGLVLAFLFTLSLLTLAPTDNAYADHEESETNAIITIGIIGVGLGALGGLSMLTGLGLDIACAAKEEECTTDSSLGIATTVFGWSNAILGGIGVVASVVVLVLAQGEPFYLIPAAVAAGQIAIGVWGIYEPDTPSVVVNVSMQPIIVPGQTPDETMVGVGIGVLHF